MTHDEHMRVLEFRERAAALGHGVDHLNDERVFVLVKALDQMDDVAAYEAAPDVVRRELERALDLLLGARR